MNSEFQRQSIRNQINDNIRKYEQSRIVQKEQQQRQKLLIKKNILEHLINRHRGTSSTNGFVQEGDTISGCKNPNEFSYSFGNREMQPPDEFSHQVQVIDDNDIEKPTGLIDEQQQLPIYSNAHNSSQNNTANNHADVSLTFRGSVNLLQKQEELQNISSQYGQINGNRKQASFNETQKQLEQHQHELRKSNQCKVQKNQTFEGSLTESSKYGSFFTANRQPTSQILQSSNLLRANGSQKLNSGQQPLRSPQTTKKENTINLFPSEQFEPKPKSPLRKLPESNPSPPRTPGNIYTTGERSSARQLQSLRSSGSSHYNIPNDDIAQLQESSSSLRVSEQILSQKMPLSREQLTSKKQITSQKSSTKQMPSTSSIDNFSKSFKPIPNVALEKIKEDTPPPLKKFNELVPLSQVEGQDNEKGYGTYIHDDVDEEHIEQLRKKKIDEMEKKRQKRTEDRKKSADQKSLLKESNPNSQLTQTTFQPQQNHPPTANKYSAIHNKRVQKAKEPEDTDMKSNQTVHSYKSLSKPIESGKKDDEVRRVVKPEIYRQQDSNNGRSHNSAKYIENPNTFVPFSDGKTRNQSPSQMTPKTISTNKTIKTSNSKSIFQEPSPGKSREKSHNKYSHEPKIQPKDRKQTFTKQSNRKLMINAITNVCLPSQINRKEREKLLDIINNDPAEYFIFLFKEYSRKIIKGIYSFDSINNRVRKIYGDKAPAEILAENVSQFYRYDSGAREFKILDGCKSFSYVVHGVFIK